MMRYQDRRRVSHPRFVDIPVSQEMLAWTPRGLRGCRLIWPARHRHWLARQVEAIDDLDWFIVWDISNYTHTEQ
jgi:hypothetical protein